MNHQLSSSAQRVQSALNKFGVEFQVIELPQSTRTAKEAADTIGCSVSQIVKSLIFKAKTSGEAILVLASGTNRVDESKVSAALGEPIEKADANFVRAKTGFAIGGVSPVGHLNPIKTFLDSDLFQFEELWAAAGTPNTVFKLNSSDLMKLCGGLQIAVK